MREEDFDSCEYPWRAGATGTHEDLDSVVEEITRD